MPIKIGGDTLALDAEIRRHIENEAEKLAARFPGEQIDARATIQEEFDPLHGHRVRCELSAKIGQGHQVVIRDARKTAHEAINEAFGAARRNLRRARRKIPLSARPLTTQLPISAARAVGG
jgi:ribosome-associated translation inhibitor RaiA